ncbi:MAG: 1-acyl-sn-glycerol-3-phosphate acyltransferase [Actinomycetaceae bacterium]|nr:1-acyl-sn-glycerol-3-phosphate acyltransferase [Actinomycetaceae bacterium]
MNIKKTISRIFQKAYPLDLSVEPLPRKAVVIGAPHTSMFDAVLMLVAFWDQGRDLKFLIKDSFLKKPVVGPLLRSFGGIPVDRSHPNGGVGSIVEQAKASDDFILVLAPEGTRAKKDYWRSGFYYIAQGANLPIHFGFIDKGKLHAYGWKDSIRVSGDVVADMDKIRAFYADKSGLRPELKTPPLLRVEVEDATDSGVRSGTVGADGAPIEGPVLAATDPDEHAVHVND